MIRYGIWFLRSTDSTRRPGSTQTNFTGALCIATPKRIKRGLLLYQKIACQRERKSPTPTELERLPEVNPPGFHRVEIFAPDIAEFLARLRKRPTVHEATIFGQSIHALVEDGDTLSDITGPDVALRPASATLEDVFVTIARNRNRELAEAS